MKLTLDPGKGRRSINFIDNIPYTSATDEDGKRLTLSLMLQNGNSEMRLSSFVDDEIREGKQPLIIWINGFGWRKSDKNIMAAEMEFLAEHGYAVAFVSYRHSGSAKFPSQLIDIKSAVRFLRAHAEEYHLDGERVGTIGRSAGGHLSAFMAMNTLGYDEGDYLSISSTVQAAVDLFGPVDLVPLYDLNQRLIQDPSFRWHHALETHEGALLGGPEETLRERAAAASPINYISDATCPIQIIHGDQDPLVPLAISEEFYNRLLEKGKEETTEFIILKNGGHGTREFFQLEAKEYIASFFDRYLK